MTNHRIHWIAAFLLVTTTNAVPTAHAQHPTEQVPLDEKGAFIVDAMNQVNRESWEVAQEGAKRGIRYLIVGPPTIVPFGDWDYYYIEDDEMEWQPNPGQTFQPVTVPRGFVSDLTSVPRIFWSALPRQGRYAYAALIHDYLYWIQDRSRLEADQVLRVAMEDSKVDQQLVLTIYRAVRVAGGASWDNNAKLKKAGEKRILKEFPDDFTISWSEWKRRPDVFAD